MLLSSRLMDLESINIKRDMVEIRKLKFFTVEVISLKFITNINIERETLEFSQLKFILLQT